MNKNCGVYIIRNIDSGKVYVGSSKTIKSRLRQHFTALCKGSHHSVKLQRSWNKHGVPAFAFEYLFLCDENDLIKYEQQFIDLYESATSKGYNSCPKAGNTLGVKFSDEVKAKFSAMRKGRPVLLEARVKISEAMKGKTFTDKHRASISDSAKRRANSPEGKKQLASVRRKSIPQEELERRSATRRANRDAKLQSLGVAPKVKASCKREVACESCGKVFVTFNQKAKNCSRLCEQRSRRAREAANSPPKQKYEYTPEARLKMSLAKKGRKLSPEHRASLSRGQRARSAGRQQCQL